MLVGLAVGATANLLYFGNFVQPYCALAPDENVEMCRPCGLRWEMFGALGATQCPQSLIDEVLTLFIVVPRLLFVLFGVAWMVTAPLLVLNVVTLVGRWRRGEKSALSAVQLGLLAYVLAWGLAAAVFFLVPEFASSR